MVIVNRDCLGNTRASWRKHHSGYISCVVVLFTGDDRKPLYLFQGRSEVCVHSILPRSYLWDHIENAVFVIGFSFFLPFFVLYIVDTCSSFWRWWEASLLDQVMLRTQLAVLYQNMHQTFLCQPIAYLNSRPVSVS